MGLQRVMAGPNQAQFPVVFPVSREFAVENSLRWTARTASQPCAFLSECPGLEIRPTFPAVRSTLGKFERPFPPAICRLLELRRLRKRAGIPTKNLIQTVNGLRVGYRTALVGASWRTQVEIQKPGRLTGCGSIVSTGPCLSAAAADAVESQLSPPAARPSLKMATARARSPTFQ